MSARRLPSCGPGAGSTPVGCSLNSWPVHDFGALVVTSAFDKRWATSWAVLNRRVRLRFCTLFMALTVVLLLRLGDCRGVQAILQGHLPVYRPIPIAVAIGILLHQGHRPAAALTGAWR